MTTLKPGVRYDLVNSDESSPGYLLDNVYIENGHPAGELQGEVLLYAMTKGRTGELVFKDGIAGHLQGREIVRADDGVRFRLVEAE